MTVGVEGDPTASHQIRRGIIIGPGWKRTTLQDNNLGQFDESLRPISRQHTTRSRPRQLTYPFDDTRVQYHLPHCDSSELAENARLE
jgi:hypothetical protein